MEFSLNKLALVAFGVLMLLAAGLHAVPAQVCGPNGYYDSSINDCRFSSMPSGTVACDGPLSKYKTTCVDGTLYDFTGVTSYYGTYYVNGVAQQGQVCVAKPLTSCGSSNTPSGDYNQPSSGYVPPSDNGGGSVNQQGYNDYSYGNPNNYDYYSYSNPNDYNYYSYNTPYSYCGDGYCSAGESSYSCPRDCSFNNNFNGGFSYSSCSLYALPHTINPGSYSEIRVSYVNVGYSPYYVLVDCGNGRFSYASGCSYETGYCFASCYYPNSGYYVQNAVVGGSYCSPSSVSVTSGSGSTPNPSSNPPTPTPVRCADGTLSGQCSFNNPPKYCVNGVLVNQASVCGCPAGLVAQGDACVPRTTPTPLPSATPTPVFAPSCRVSSNPTYLDSSGDAAVTVFYGNFNSAVSNVNIDCGNGRVASASCTGALSGSCLGVCSFEQKTTAKTYIVSAAVSNFACTSTSVSVAALSSATPSPSANGALIASVKEIDSGAPISNVFVSLRLNGQSVAGDYSDSNGVTAFSNLVSSSYSITAGKNGYESKTIVASVASSQTTSVELLLKKLSSGSGSPSSCSMIVSPNIVRAGGSVSVSLSGSSGSALISCGNGQVKQVSCSGSCSTVCSYGTENYYPQYYSVSSTVNGASCGSKQVQVVSPVSTTGSVLARVTDCASGALLQSTQVFGGGQTAFTDSSGLVTISSLPVGSQSFSFSKSGYDSSQSSANVLAGQTASLSVCLNKAVQSDSCGFSTEVVRSPECPYSTTQQPYQIKVKNLQSTSKSIAVSYSNNALSGPSTVLLNGNAETIINLYSFANDNFAGGNLVIASFNDGSCTKNVQLQACQSGGLTLEAVEKSKDAFVGQKTCFDLLVRNKGLAKALVTLSSDNSDGVNEFSQKQFFISQQETKDIQYCVTPNTVGLKSIFLTASSEIGPAYATVSLNAVGQSSFNDSSSSCVPINADSTLSNYAVSVFNNALSGDFEVSVSGNDLNAMVVQDKLYGFEKGSSRTVQLRLDAFDKGAGDYRFDLMLSNNGRVVYQKNLCYTVIGERRTSLSVSPNVINVQPGKSGVATVNVLNTGTIGQTYSLFVDSTQVSASINPSNLYIKPGETGSFDVVITGNTVGAYSIPIRLRTGYSYNSYYSNNYNNGYNNYNVNIDCGNGRTQSVSCQSGSSSCSASCDYPYTGTFYPSASIGGVSCTSSRVNVVNNLDNDCWVDVSEQVMRGNSATVTVNYKSLSQSANDFQINCGNGNTVTASCSGTTGSCSASCPSYSSDGTYDVSASNSFKTCQPARIAVSDSSLSTCRMAVADPTIEDGNNDRVSLYYYNIGSYNNGNNNNGNNGNNNYNSIDSVNVLVNVLGTPAKYTPIVSENLQIVTPSEVELTPGGSASFNVIVKNNFYYSLQSVLLSFRSVPQGVVIQQVSPFSLNAGEEKTVRVYVTSDKNAVLARSDVTMKADSPSASSIDYKVSIRVRDSTPQELVAAVGKPSFEFIDEGGVQTIALSIPVTNNDAGAVSYQVSMTLPQGWTYAAQSFSLTAGASTDLKIKLNAPDYKDSDYEAVLRLQSNDKVKTTSITIPSKSKFSSLSGLFTAASSIETLVLFLVVAGLLVAGFLAYNANKMNKELGV